MRKREKATVNIAFTYTLLLGKLLLLSSVFNRLTRAFLYFNLCFEGRERIEEVGVRVSGCGGDDRRGRRVRVAGGCSLYPN